MMEVTRYKHTNTISGLIAMIPFLFILLVDELTSRRVDKLTVSGITNNSFTCQLVHS